MDTAEKLRRLRDLEEMIARGVHNRQELAALLQVSARTVTRDIRTLRIAGSDISYAQKRLAIQRGIFQ